MKKNLLLASLFLVNFCIAHEESVVTSISNTEQSEFTPTSLVLDFIVQPEAICETWLEMIENTKSTLVTMNGISNNPENASTTALDETLQLTKTLYDIATGQNDLHGVITYSAYMTNDSGTTFELDDAPSDYIIVRISITKINEQNPELWQTIQDGAQTLIETIENIENEYPYEIINRYVNELAILANSDNNISLHRNIHIVYSDPSLTTSDNSAEEATVEEITAA